MQNESTISINTSFGLIRKVVLFFAVIGVLGGCGHKEGDKAVKPTQTIARVNGDEITVSQLNNELQKSGVRPEQQDAASKQIVQLSTHLALVSPLPSLF